MGKDRRDGGAKPPQTGAGEKRAQRLSAALKANLKRRKAQARGRRDEEGSGKPAGEAGGDD